MRSRRHPAGSPGAQDSARHPVPGEQAKRSCHARDQMRWYRPSATTPSLYPTRAAGYPCFGASASEGSFVTLDKFLTFIVRWVSHCRPPSFLAPLDHVSLFVSLRSQSRILSIEDTIGRYSPAPLPPLPSAYEARIVVMPTSWSSTRQPTPRKTQAPTHACMQANTKLPQNTNLPPRTQVANARTHARTNKRPRRTELTASPLALLPHRPLTSSHSSSVVANPSTLTTDSSTPLFLSGPSKKRSMASATLDRFVAASSGCAQQGGGRLKRVGVERGDSM